MSAQKVTIFQPYVPRYRVPFFEGLYARLLEHGVSLGVASGRPHGHQALRRDQTTEDHRWMAGDVRRNLPAFVSPGVLVFGLRGISPLLNSALTLRATGGPKVAVWGHVKPYVQRGNSADLFVERWQMRMADLIFSYTRGGFDFAVANGIEKSKIVNLNNSLDVTEMLLARRRLTWQEVSTFKELHDIGPSSRCLAFLGGLDDTKRPEFLAASLDYLWNIAPDVKLLVGGEGAQAGILAPAERRRQVIRLGFADSKLKAMMAEVCNAMVMPGRVGLVAVESLAMGLPVLTTEWAYHAPEVEYLQEGMTRFTSPQNDSAAFARLMAQFAGHRAQATSFEYPTLEQMVDNFSNGVLMMLGKRRG
jgi:glycosyltransferase involved in cell wall biosynthesis